MIKHDGLQPEWLQCQFHQAILFKNSEDKCVLQREFSTAGLSLLSSGSHPGSIELMSFKQAMPADQKSPSSKGKILYFLPKYFPKAKLPADLKIPLLLLQKSPLVWRTEEDRWVITALLFWNLQNEHCLKDNVCPPKIIH